MEYIINRLRYLLRKFKELKNYAETNYLKTLYLALLQQHLTLGIIFWG